MSFCVNSETNSRHFFAALSQMPHGSASKTFRIVCVGDPSVKASRYRFSGAIRYAAEHADLTVISVNFDDSRLNSRAALDKILAEKIHQRLVHVPPDRLTRHEPTDNEQDCRFISHCPTIKHTKSRFSHIGITRVNT